MVIGICDDDKQWRESCKRTLEGFSLMIELTIEIKCFATAGELLEYKGTPLDAVFLDIELGRENGIFVAKKLSLAKLPDYLYEQLSSLCDRDIQYRTYMVCCKKTFSG